MKTIVMLLTLLAGSSAFAMCPTPGLTEKNLIVQFENQSGMKCKMTRGSIGEDEMGTPLPKGSILTYKCQKQETVSLETADTPLYKVISESNSLFNSTLAEATVRIYDIESITANPCASGLPGKAILDITLR